jgi:hypothetical protein
MTALDKRLDEIREDLRPMREDDQEFSVPAKYAHWVSHTDFLLSEIERLEAERQQEMAESIDPRDIGAIRFQYEIDGKMRALTSVQLNDYAQNLLKQLSTARDAALEEAAKVCDDLSTRLYDDGEEWRSFGADDCRDAIRALKSKPTGGG